LKLFYKWTLFIKESLIISTITYVDNSQIVGLSEEAIESDSERKRKTGLKRLLSMNWRSRLKTKI
jgi:hypothetical protein